MSSIKEFMKATKSDWIAAVHEGSLQKDDAEVDPQDAVKSSDSGSGSMVPVMLDTTIRTDLT